MAATITPVKQPLRYARQFCCMKGPRTGKYCVGCCYAPATPQRRKSVVRRKRRRAQEDRS